MKLLREKCKIDYISAIIQGFRHLILLFETHFTFSLDILCIIIAKKKNPKFFKTLSFH